VLELGVGYGRLLSALSRAARSVVGLDSEPELLKRARRAAKGLEEKRQGRIRFTLGRMEGFDLGRTFERILLPYNGLYCLLTPRALRSCLRNVRRHLAPGGEFLFDVWAADRFHAQRDPGAYHDDEEPILQIQRGAQRWDVFEQSRWFPRTQRLNVVYTYVTHGHAPITIPIAQRYALSRELFALLKAQGFELRSAHGGFAGQRFGARSEHLVVRARAS
jgi:SAM-dependent methyltransferase